MSFARRRRLCRHMRFPNAAIALTIESRRRSHDFFRAAFGLEPIGEEIASDGLPEPLQFRVNDDLAVVLVPRGGFRYVIGEHEPAARDAVECLVQLPCPARADVDELVERAQGAGARVVSGPKAQPWGVYEGVVADPDGHLWVLAADDAERG